VPCLSLAHHGYTMNSSFGSGGVACVVVGLTAGANVRRVPVGRDVDMYRFIRVVVIARVSGAVGRRVVVVVVGTGVVVVVVLNCVDVAGASGRSSIIASTFPTHIAWL
jgi:hypothetical protein